MEASLDYLFKFLAVAILVVANAFFVATEFALVGVRRSRMQACAKRGVGRANIVLAAIKDLDRYIAGTQLGITLASLALGWIGEAALETAMYRMFYFLPDSVIEFGAPTIAAFLVITFLHVVLGELVPKSLALQHTDATALRVAAPMRFVVTLMSPMIWALNSTGNLVLKMLGLEGSANHDGHVHSIEELKILVEDSHRQGILDETERSMLQRVFKIKELVARQVMVHRLDIIGLPIDMPYEGLMLAVVGSPYSKYPVYEGDLDHIAGILVIKDLIGFRHATRATSSVPREILRPPLFVPENASVETVLEQFKRAEVQMAIVLDEFGGTSGLVTLQDIVEEVFGELEGIALPSEKADVAEVAWPIVVEGRSRLDVLNERYDLALKDEDADTIAGLVTNCLGRVPAEGEEVVVGNVVIGVQSTEGLRITSLSLAPVEKQDIAEADSVPEDKP